MENINGDAILLVTAEALNIGTPFSLIVIQFVGLTVGGNEGTDREMVTVPGRISTLICRTGFYLYFTAMS